MPFTPKTWTNTASTPINADELNRIEAGIVGATNSVTLDQTASFYLRKAPDFAINRAYGIGELVVQGGIIYRRIAAGTPASFITSEWSAISGAASAPGTILVLLWNGSNFVDPDGLVATSVNRPAKTYRMFIGGPDAAGLGLKIDGDQQVVA